MSNPGIKELEQFRNAIIEAGEIMVEQLSELFDQLRPLMQALYDAFWQAYRDSGSPYGDTDEGLLRWAKEIGEAHRMRLESERILAHHQMLADFRKKVSSRLTNKSL